jgi:hypothetical protein
VTEKKMEERKAILMAVIVVSALIAFIAPISAVSIGEHDIAFDNRTFDGTNSTWTYNVTSGSKPSLGYWIMTWCDESAIVEASEKWEYGEDKKTGITGIKFDKGYKDEESRTVWFKLEGNFGSGDVKVGTKAGKDIDASSVEGPTCDTHIPEMPEFTTIAIPVAATIGLLLLIRRRKQK